jgi:biotin carboxyl carrier protein
LSEVTEVQSDIAATVWQVRAEVGHTAAVGDVLIVLESMKMEIPVECPVAGRVTEVRVAAQDRVEEGDVLVVLESDG